MNITYINGPFSSRFQWDLPREMIEDIEGDSFWQSGIDMENH